MKKRNSFLLLGVLILILSACHHHRYRTRTVRVSNDGYSLKIEYCGDVTFNDDETRIDAISPNGYVKYKSNNKCFVAESNEDGDIRYKIYERNRQLDYDSEDARALIASTVKEIAEHYGR